jgi:hypothetical protein
MCHVYGATIDVDRFFLKGKELLKENLKIILVKKEKTGNVQLGYIEDIHVMVVFVAC